jgi:hypothetical protein
VGELEKVTQRNTANAEELSASSEEMSAQSESLRGLVLGLSRRLEGGEAPAAPAAQHLAPRPAPQGARVTQRSGGHPLAARPSYSLHAA